MNPPAPIVSDVRRVIVQLQDIKVRYRKKEEDAEFREWCEGILDAAIAALRVITGE